MEDRSVGVGRETISALRRMARARIAEEARASDRRCDLCGLPLTAAHRHLFEVSTRKIVRACQGCAMSFQAVVGGRFKLIPREARVLNEFSMTEAQWENLSLPIGVAFFFHDSMTGKMTAMYPSPAGATESPLSLENWQELAAANPVLTKMAPDVEALLVNRLGTAPEYFIAPIDQCYELVGLIRKYWRGLAGGDSVFREAEHFFDRLRGPARTSRHADH